jgi:enoyl-[acyl-carrier protein] reductase II
MLRFGVEALILEGSEAGGHIGHVSLTILLQQVLFERRDIPIFVAGGIATGTMMAHMLLMGAAGIQMGTRFVMTDECKVHENFKKAFIRAPARAAISTPQYDSKLPVVAVRALKNKGMEAFGRLQLDLLKKLEAGEIHREQAQYEVESFWMGGLKKAAIDGDVDNGSVMAGQSVGLMHDVKPMNTMMKELIEGAGQELARVKGLL